MQHVIPIRLIGHFKILSKTFELIPSAVDMPIITKLVFLIGEEILQFIWKIRVLIVTNVAGPVKKGAGALTNQAANAPKVPIKIVIVLAMGIRIPTVN